MRAIVLEQTGGPEVLKLTERPTPEPAADQVQIRVAYVGLNPLDTLVRTGAFGFHPPLPFIMGKGYSGIITKVGAGVDPTRVGQRVACQEWGGYADYAICAADAAQPIPDDLDWKLGTVALTPAVTAWHLLHTVARSRQDDLVVVHAAAGAVGMMLVQIAKDLGAHVIGLAGSAEKITWAQRHATADLWLDYRAEGEWPGKVKAFAADLTPGKAGADFIFDGNQGPEALKNLNALAPLGQVVFIGAMAGPAPPVPISSLVAGSVGVRGFVVQHGMRITQGTELGKVLPKLASGSWAFPIAPAVPLEQVIDLHRAAGARTLLGRGIISVGGDL